jgi:hypothetical protein
MGGQFFAGGLLVACLVPADGLPTTSPCFPALSPFVHIDNTFLLHSCWTPAAPVRMTVEGQTDEDLLHLLAHDTGKGGGV